MVHAVSCNPSCTMPGCLIARATHRGGSVVFDPTPSWCHASAQFLQLYLDLQFSFLCSNFRPLVALWLTVVNVTSLAVIAAIAATAIAPNAATIVAGVKAPPSAAGTTAVYDCSCRLYCYICSC